MFVYQWLPIDGMFYPKSIIKQIFNSRPIKVIMELVTYFTLRGDDP